MNRRGMALAISLVVVVVSAGCRGGGGDGDRAAFCEAVDALRDEDPFAELPIASPEEMRDAFDQLREGADRIADAAPPDIRGRAVAYRDSVDELVDQLRGAGFDPRNVDPLAYQRAVADYQDAAESVDNNATSLCP